MKKLGVLVLHGMGDQGENFAEPLIEELEERLEDMNLDPNDIAWEPVWWAPVLADAQKRLWKDLRAGHDLSYRRLRKFLIHYVADSFAYRKVDANVPATIHTYDEIHAEVAAALQRLRTTTRRGRRQGDPEAPLFIVAHSLGCHIISNYIWDIQRDLAADFAATTRGNELEDLKTLAGIATFGCNIPFFVLAHKNVQPISFPLDAADMAAFFPSGTNLNALRKAMKWHNYFDPDDVLGWPLKPLSPAYRNAVYRDHEINAGNLLTSWNPFSHLEYWTDGDLTKPIAKSIGELLRLL